MNLDREFEEQLSDWLNDGPEDAPDAVLATVLRAFPTIPQRRVAGPAWWARSLFDRYALPLVAVAAGAMLIAGFALMEAPPAGLVGNSTSSSTSPSTSTSPSAIDTSAWLSFTSSRYGLTVRYPSDWTAIRATSPWPIGALLPDPAAYRVRSPVLDTFISPDGPFFAAGSQPLPDGVTPEGWLTSYETAGAATVPSKQCWPQPAAMNRTTLGGIPAWVREGCGATDVIAFAGGRVYIFRAEIDPTLNRPLFNAFLSTVQVMPSSTGNGH